MIHPIPLLAQALGGRLPGVNAAVQQAGADVHGRRLHRIVPGIVQTGRVKPRPEVRRSERGYPHGKHS